MNEYIDYAIAYRRKLLRRIRRFVASYDDAEDLYQDMMENFLSKEHPAPPEQSYIEVYVDQMIRWMAGDLSRKSKPGFSLDQLEDGGDQVDLTFAQLHEGQLEACSDPADLLSHQEHVGKAVGVIERIASPFHRALLQSVLVDGVSPQEFADAEGYSVNAVRMVLSRFKRGELNEKGGT